MIKIVLSVTKTVVEDEIFNFSPDQIEEFGWEDLTPQQISEKLLEDPNRYDLDPMFAVSNSSLEDITFDDRDSTKVFYLLSPDGHTVELPLVELTTLSQAREQFNRWVQQFMEQGYYSFRGERIPLDKLWDRCYLHDQPFYVI